MSEARGGRTVRLYGFRKGDELVKELDGSFTLFPTFGEAEAHLEKGETVAHVTLRVRPIPRRR